MTVALVAHRATLQFKSARLRSRVFYFEQKPTKATKVKAGFVPFVGFCSISKVVLTRLLSPMKIRHGKS
jgi:hypothetical protein